jgi:hypothetical protein
MPVRHVIGRHFPKHALEVVKQERLTLVDDDGRGRVKALDVEEARDNPGFGDELLETFGQVDELGVLFGDDPDLGVPVDERGRERFHR